MRILRPPLQFVATKICAACFALLEIEQEDTETHPGDDTFLWVRGGCPCCNYPMNLLKSDFNELPKK